MAADESSPSVALKLPDRRCGDGWYNGFSPKQRAAKYTVLLRLMQSGEVPLPKGPCSLCGDPDVPVEYHSEDYAGPPFSWTAPAMYALCRHCHRSKLHQRFKRPKVWQMLLAHVRRGGYASELNDPEIVTELAAHRASGGKSQLRTLRPYQAFIESEWFTNI